MILRAALLGLLTIFSISSSCGSSFQRDVVKRVEQRNRFLGTDVTSESSLEDALLSKAIPLKEYKAKLEAAGATLERQLEDGEEEDKDEGDEGDDYYIDEDYMYSFSGWSLKYAKCQAIQRFSADAVENGEYSALVTDDVVVLRLCPSRVCSSSSEYGCHYNFAEYAIGLGEYLKIMLKYTYDKRRNLCNFCAKCDYQRWLEEEGEEEGDEEDKDEEDDRDEDEDEEEDNESEEENEAEEAGDDYYVNDDYVVQGDDGVNDDGGCGDCCTYQEDCANVADWCDGESDDGVYMDLLDYTNYLDCVQVDGQGNYEGQAYWVRPYCDPSKEIIKMHLFSDPYCSQVTKEVNVNDFTGLYFQSSMFEDYYSGTCIDCSESNDPPYYNSGSYLCNKMHRSSAKCTNNMVYDLFDGSEQTSSTECSFIESIRFGTYDKDGSVSSQNSEFGVTVEQKVTAFQKAFLIVSILTCFVLGVYACYLHHAITNLLIKSLSHSTLLPPVKRRSRGGSRASSRSRKKRHSSTDEGDWDNQAVAKGQMA